MTRPDRKEARRARALENLKLERERTKAQISHIEENLDAFERNERSLEKPTVIVLRELQVLRRKLDRQNMQIGSMTNNPNRMTISVARFIDENPKDW